MEVHGLLFPFDEATEDGRAVASVEVDLDLGPVPIYYEQRAVGIVNRLYAWEKGLNIEGTILDLALIESWQDEALSFQGELDQVQAEDGFNLSGRLRRVALGHDPAFDGTTVYRKQDEAEQTEGQSSA